MNPIDLSQQPAQLERKVFTETDRPGFVTDQNGQLCADISLIDHSDRVRQDYGDLSDLCDSIKLFGLLEPVGVVQENGSLRLRYGGRRVKAFLLSGRKYIPITFAPEDPILCEAAELEENIKRKDLSPLETIQCQERVHALRMKLHGGTAQGTNPSGWNQEKTAALLGISTAALSQNLKLAKRIKTDKELKKKIEGLPLTAALKVLGRTEETDQLADQIKSGQLKVSQDLVLGSCLDQVPTLADQSVDLWLSDPPFGNTSIDQDRGTSRSSVVYTSLIGDTDNLNSEQIRVLLSDLVPLMAQKLKKGAHTYLFFAFEHYQFLTDLLRKHDFLIEHAPIIWYKNRSTTPFMGHNYPSSYEPILFGCFQEKTRRLHGEQLRNLITCPPVPDGERAHRFAKPVKLLADLITNSTAEGELVVDTFAGSAQVLKAAMGLKRRAWGCEIDQNNYNAALLNLANSASSETKS